MFYVRAFITIVLLCLRRECDLYKIEAQSLSEKLTHLQDQNTRLQKEVGLQSEGLEKVKLEAKLALDESEREQSNLSTLLETAQEVNNFQKEKFPLVR